MTTTKQLTPADDPAKQTKLWRLLEIGLRDAETQENAPDSALFMQSWLQPDCQGECLACLAGSVMRHTCGLVSAPDDVPRWAESLDRLRCGDVRSAGGRLGAKNWRSFGKHDRDVPEYSDDRDGWWTAMRQLLADLRDADV